ncbi:MAG: hypothetical protein RIS57_952 [Actinomycetota bacterium]
MTIKDQPIRNSQEQSIERYISRTRYAPVTIAISDTDNPIGL